jgi:hypothetical protein
LILILIFFFFFADRSDIASLVPLYLFSFNLGFFFIT